MNDSEKINGIMNKTDPFIPLSPPRKSVRMSVWINLLYTVMNQ